MTFKPINRGRMAPADGFSATPSDCVRLSTYRGRPGGKVLLVIWLGSEVASAIGLRERREMVEILCDDSSEATRIAIRRSAQGEFVAAKKLRAYSVHLDAAASALIVSGMMIGRDIFGPDQIKFEDGMVVFAVPENRATGGQL